MRSPAPAVAFAALQFASLTVIVFVPCKVMPGLAQCRLGINKSFVPQSKVPRTRRTVPEPVKLPPLCHWKLPANDCVAPKLVSNKPLLTPFAIFIVPDCNNTVPRFVRFTERKLKLVPPDRIS